MMLNTPHSVSELTEVLILTDDTLGKMDRDINPLMDAWTSQFYQGIPSVMGESMRAKGMSQGEVDNFVEQLAAQFRSMSNSVQMLKSYCTTAQERGQIILDIVRDGATRARKAEPPGTEFQI